MVLIKYTIFFYLFSIIFSHDCISDEIQKKTKISYLMPSPEKTFEQNKLLFKNDIILESQFEWRPIRITIDTSRLQINDKKKEEFLKKELLPKAIEFYESSFYVFSNKKIVYNANYCDQIMISRYYRTTALESDILVFVESGFHNSNILAAATFCVLDQTNNYRPIMGRLIVNPTSLKLDKMHWEEQYSTMIHELAHILAFNSYLFPFFTNPKTKRFWGINNVVKETKIRGVDTTILILPKLKKFAQEYYNCPSLEGVELENQGSKGSRGSHWEKRILINEVRNDNSMPIYWGKDMGCEFVNEPCFMNNKTKFPDLFCNPYHQKTGCFYDLSARSFCAAQVNQTLTNSAFDYFFNGTKTYDSFIDNCPFQTSYLDGDCRYPENEGSFHLYFGQVFGDNSRCFLGNYFKKNIVARLIFNHYGFIQCPKAKDVCKYIKNYPTLLNVLDSISPAKDDGKKPKECSKIFILNIIFLMIFAFVISF